MTIESSITAKKDSMSHLRLFDTMEAPSLLISQATVSSVQEHLAGVWKTGTRLKNCPLNAALAHLSPRSTTQSQEMQRSLSSSRTHWCVFLTTLASKAMQTHRKLNFSRSSSKSVTLKKALLARAMKKYNSGSVGYWSWPLRTTRGSTWMSFNKTRGYHGSHAWSGLQSLQLLRSKRTRLSLTRLKWMTAFWVQWKLSKNSSRLTMDNSSLTFTKEMKSFN